MLLWPLGCGGDELETITCTFSIQFTLGRYGTVASSSKTVDRRVSYKFVRVSHLGCWWIK